VIDFCKLAAVTARRLLVRQLCACGLHMSFAHGLLFLRPGPCINTARAVKACTPVNSSVIDNRTIYISIMNYSGINPYNCGIVTEMVALPAAAGKT
jgi:hypothetical protein